MWFDETGLRWVPISPHVPPADSASYYAATSIMGEFRVIGEGVGYTLPFEVAGAPWIDPHRLADSLNQRSLAGGWPRWTPSSPHTRSSRFIERAQPITSLFRTVRRIGARIQNAKVTQASLHADTGRIR